MQLSFSRITTNSCVQFALDDDERNDVEDEEQRTNRSGVYYVIKSIVYMWWLRYGYTFIRIVYT